MATTTTEDVVPLLRAQSSFIDIPIMNTLLCMGEKTDDGCNRVPSVKGNPLHVDPNQIPIDARVLLVVLKEVKGWSIDSCNL